MLLYRKIYKSCNHSFRIKKKSSNIFFASTPEFSFLKVCFWKYFLLQISSLGAEPEGDKNFQIYFIYIETWRMFWSWHKTKMLKLSMNLFLSALFLKQDIFSNMGSWLYKVNNEGQLRWLGPEKGVIGNYAFKGVLMV